MTRERFAVAGERSQDSPQLAPHWIWHLDQEGTLLLVSEREARSFRGRVFPELVPLLDGRRRVRELIECLTGMVSASEIHFALSRLAEAGCLTGTSCGGQEASEAAFWNLHEIDPGLARTRLEEAAVWVEDWTGGAALAAREALSGIPLRESAQAEAKIALVIVRDYLDSRLEDWHREWQKSGRPWIPVRPFGAETWIGPLFDSGVGACYECLADRLRKAPTLDTLLSRRAGTSLPLAIPRAALAGTVDLALRLAALELARWFAGAAEATKMASTLVSFDLRRLAIRRHRVVRRPQCPRCGDAGMLAARGWSPLELRSCRKASIEDNGYRQCEPAATFRLFSHHVSPITGVVRELECVEGQDDEALTVFRAVPNLRPRDAGLEAAVPGEVSVCAGKGLSMSQARASALCEAVERYSASFHGDEARFVASRAELGEDAIHPDLVLRYSGRQYQERDRFNRAEPDRRRWIPEPFRDDKPVEWTPVWSLTRGKTLFLPTALCYLDHPAPFGGADSNGTAAGNSVEEAILQGFLELVERDAVAIWWYNRIPRPAVDLETFDDPRLKRIWKAHRRLGREVWILDLRTDLGLPVYVAVSKGESEDRLPEVLLGFGAHLDPQVAASRALTEVSQVVQVVRTLAAPRDYRPGMAPGSRASFLEPSIPGQVVTPPSPPWPAAGDLKDDVEGCVALAARHGLEVLVLDQTRPDVGLPVVKVVAPGLRHPWPRLAPGRLYDVPVGLGWLAKPLREEDLNPHPTPF